MCSIRLRVSTQDFYYLFVTTFKISTASTTVTPSLLTTRFLTPCCNLKFLILQINCFKFPWNLATLPHSPNFLLINIRNRNIKYWSQFITCRPNSDIAVLLQFCIHPNSLGTLFQIFHFSEAVQCSWILHLLPNVASTPNRTTTNHH